MAEGLLRDRLARRGVPAAVSSAGLLEAGLPASAHGVDVLARRGIDLRGHRSRAMTPELLAGADLVVGMERRHVREAVVARPHVWPRAFTLKELVRRGEERGPRAPGQGVAEWVAKTHAGRVHADVLGESPADDIDDPIGQPRSAYVRTADEIEDLVDRLVALLYPEGVPVE